MARILISGASGLVGAAIATALEIRGDRIVRLVRRDARDPQELRWDPMQVLPPPLVSGFDAVIHLSGESVAGRWTESKKKEIRNSRVASTQNLANALAQAQPPPQTFLCASAIGYYGNRGDEVLTEESSLGHGFLAEVSREWEEAARAAAAAGIRTVNLRIGVVLSRAGGALQQMMLPFRLGLGGRLGSGRQWFSWIHIDDVVAAVLHITDRLAPPFPRSLREGGNHDVTTSSKVAWEPRAPAPRQVSGPINIVAPNPVTNAEFTKALAKAVRRPAILPVPALLLRLGFGEFAGEGLLASARVVPKRLSENGFVFRYSELASALEDLLRSRERPAP